MREERLDELQHIIRILKDGVQILRPGGKNKMKCLICKSDAMMKSKSTYFTELENCYVIIENVPCYKCSQCGEVVYSASVMEKIDDILDKVQTIASKIFIMDYDKAA